MFKKIFTFLVSIFCSIFLFSPSCNSLLIELNDGDFSFVADTKDNTAIVRFIYISAYQKKDIVVPEYVTDHIGTKYFVKEIQENAVKNVIHRAKSISVPKSLAVSGETFKAMTWFIIYGLPIKVRP